MTIAIQQPKPTFTQRLRLWASNLKPRRLPQMQPQTISAEAPPKPLRVVIYTRENAEGSPLLDQHHATVANYCQANGYDVVGYCKGDGEGNYPQAPREAFDSAMAMIENGDADVLAVAELSQLAKSVPHLMDLLEGHFEHGPRLVSVAEGINNYPDNPGPMMRVLLRSVMDAVAADPKNVLQARLKQSVQRPEKQLSVGERIKMDRAKKHHDATRAERWAQTIEANFRRGQAKIQAEAAAMDEARKASPTIDQQIAERLRLQTERDAKRPLNSNPPKWD
jgi:DNA invertase Pin-like site-specific DNA recombinase